MVLEDRVEGIFRVRKGVCPVRSFDLICAKCGNAIDVAYNDGKATREVKTATGDFYIFKWSPDVSASELTVP
jgi:hypothetical protein